MLGSNIGTDWDETCYLEKWKEKDSDLGWLLPGRKTSGFCGPWPSAKTH